MDEKATIEDVGSYCGHHLCEIKEVTEEIPIGKIGLSCSRQTGTNIQSPVAVSSDIQGLQRACALAGRDGIYGDVGDFCLVMRLKRHALHHLLG